MAKVRIHKMVAALPAVLEANAVYHVRRAKGFDVYVTNAAGIVVAYPLNRSLFFDFAGEVANPKVWTGTAVTKADGTWIVDMSAAGFTTIPRVQAQAISKNVTVAGMAQASVGERTLTSAKGIVGVPALSVLGILAISAVGAGYEVDVIATGS